MVKIKKGEVKKAVKDAIAASLGTKRCWVPVAHPLFDGYSLLAYKGFPTRIQTYPSTLIFLRHDATNSYVWSLTAGYLPGAIDCAVREGSPGRPFARGNPYVHPGMVAPVSAKLSVCPDESGSLSDETLEAGLAELKSATPR